MLGSLLQHNVYIYVVVEGDLVYENGYVVIKSVAALLIHAVFCKNCVLQYINYSELVLHYSYELHF